MTIHCHDNLVFNTIYSAWFKIIPVFLRNKGLLLMMPSNFFSTSCAGVAAAVGEVAKGDHEKH